MRRSPARVLARSRIQLSRIFPAGWCLVRPGTFREADGLPAKDLVRVLAGELLATGGVEDRFDQQADVSGIDDGDRVAEADGCLVGEAGRQEQDSALARTGQLAGVQGADRGFPVGRGRPGAVVDEAGEVVAAQPGAVGGPVSPSGPRRSPLSGSTFSGAGAGVLR